MKKSLLSTLFGAGVQTKHVAGFYPLFPTVFALIQLQMEFDTFCPILRQHTVGRAAQLISSCTDAQRTGRVPMPAKQPLYLT